MGTGDERLEECILLTEDQIDELISLQEEQAFSGQGKRRRKRTLRKGAFSRWSLPIHWKFDGNHSEYRLQAAARSRLFGCIGDGERYIQVADRNYSEYRLQAAARSRLFGCIGDGERYIQVADMPVERC